MRTVTVPNPTAADGQSDPNLGLSGTDIISDTDAHTPPTGYVWHCLQVTAAAVFTSITGEGLRINGSDGSPAGTHEGVSLPVGYYYCNFTAFTLAEGAVTAYTKRTS